MGLWDKTQGWVSENLITPHQREEILKHEQARLNPFFFSGFIGLGVLCISFGLVSLMVEYWREIPDFLKIFGAGFLIVAALSGSYVFLKNEKELFKEAALFIGFLGIGGMIGLIAQIFDLSLDTGKGMFLWAVLSFFIVVFSKKTFLSFLWIPVFIGGFLGFFKWEFLFLFFQQVPVLTTLIFALLFLVLAFLSGQSQKVFLKSTFHWSVFLYFCVLFLGNYAAPSPWSGFFISLMLLSLMALLAVSTHRLKLFNVTIAFLVVRFLILYVQLFHTPTVWALGGIVFGSIFVIVSMFYRFFSNRN